MKHFTKTCRSRALLPPRMAGMTLVELMIALVIGLLLLSGIVAVFVNSSEARNETERSSRQIENGRYTVELLSDDLRVAGFYGELDVGTVATPGALTDPCSTATADWATAIPLQLQGVYNADSTSAPSCLLSSYNLKTGTDILVVRRASTCSAGISGCAAAVNGSPYLQVSLCSTESPTTPYVLGLSGTATFSLHKKDCATTADTRQYVVHIYFISTDNGNGQNIPTLKELELNGAGWTVTPLVEGIEQLHFEYGIDTDGDGEPDTYQSDPTTYACAGCTAVSNWMNVMTARLYVLARNTEPTLGFSDTKTYSLGSVAAGPFNDAYRRHVYTGLVRINNPAGRRDTP